MKFEKPTPIQEQSIPVIIEGRDLIACAQTGTGKTAAFLLPLIDRLCKAHVNETNTLVIVPTRELAIQIDEFLQGISYFTPVTSLAIFGGNNGMAFEQEKKALTEGTNIIISTPGRLIAHLNMGYVKFDKVKHLVLDEADRMLDMGFAPDLDRIFKHLPAQRQNIMFSATMPEKIRKLARQLLNNPVEINIAISKPAEGVRQGAFIVFETQKNPVLEHVLKTENPSSVIIFSSTKDKVKEVDRILRKMGFDVAAIHSDLEQEQRNEVLRNFKSKRLQILVATDVLSRGIDIDSIAMVINYDVPSDAEDYVHRVGRTARAETTGTAYTFVNEQDQRKFGRIEDLIGMTVEKISVPEQFGPQPVYDPSPKPKVKSGIPNQHGKKKKTFFKNRKPKSGGKS